MNKNEWEVGLAEIGFPHSWLNLTEEEGIINVVIQTRRGKVTYSRIKIPFGFYSNFEEFKNVFNSNCDPQNDNNSMVAKILDQNTMSLSLQVATNKTITLTTSLSNKLGFEGITEFESGIHKTNKPFDIDSGTHHMFVCSNVVEETCVGNTYIKLLRTVETKEDVFQRTITKTFDTPLYKRLSSYYENSVEISIMSIDGQQFNFMSGTVFVVLHFKKLKK